MSVELLDSMGTDLTVVNAARVSYAKESKEFSGRDEKLIAFLMREGHGSPFEHCVFSFRVKAPMFVARQWMRHRISSFSEQSGRWTEFEPEFYYPDPESGWYYEVKEHSNRCFEKYQELLSDGWTKENARMVLPQNLLTTFWWTVNARSLMNFLMLRSASDAQHQIQEYAGQAEKFFCQNMPVSHAAFNEYGRKAP